MRRKNFFKANRKQKIACQVASVGIEDRPDAVNDNCQMINSRVSCIWQFEQNKKLSKNLQTFKIDTAAELTCDCHISEFGGGYEF